MTLLRVRVYAQPRRGLLWICRGRGTDSGFGGVELDLNDREQVGAVELEATRRDPYRQLSQDFHLVGRKA